MTTVDEQRDAVTLKLTGENAERGLELSDLQQFVRHFVAALRGFDRTRRSQPAIKGGHPARRDEAVTAFRLVGFRTGSAVMALEPAAPAAEKEEALFDGEEDDPAIENVHALTDALAAGESLHADVADFLEQARRTLGRDKGAIEVSLPARLGRQPLKVDRDRIERSAGPTPDSSAVSMVSGRLHLIDTEPDRIGVRSPQGVDWTCRYEEQLEAEVKGLIDEIVIVEGRGERRTLRTGAMEISSIRRAYDYEQPALFAAESVAVEDLGEQQAITEPQGLASLGDPDWTDDEPGDRFLDYVLGRV